VPWILWAQLEFLEGKCISFAAKFTHDPETPLCCASSVCAFFGDISNPAAFLFTPFGYQIFFCFLACLLLKAEPFSETLPLILKLLYSLEMAKFEISIYFTTTVHFSGLFSL